MPFIEWYTVWIRQAERQAKSIRGEYCFEQCFSNDLRRNFKG